MAGYNSGILGLFMGGGMVDESRYANYSKKAAYAYMDKHGNAMEIASLMFRYSPRSVEMMDKKEMRLIAASCIANNMTYNGCPVFIAKLNKALDHFTIENNTALVVIDNGKVIAPVEGVGTSTSDLANDTDAKTELDEQKIIKCIDKTVEKLENLVHENLTTEETMVKATKIITKMGKKIGNNLEIFSDPKVVANVIGSIFAGADVKGIFGDIVEEAKAAAEHPTDDEPETEDRENSNKPTTIDLQEGEYKEERVEKEFDTSSKFIPSDNDSSKESGKVRPIIFHYDKMDLNPGAVDPNLNNQQKKTLNKINEFMSTLIPDKYNWEVKSLISGMMELDIFDNGAFVKAFYIDPCIVQGNGFYMLAPTELGQAAVPFSRRDLIQSAICGRVLTKEEHNECNAVVFENGDLYGYIDMSGVSKFSSMKGTTYRKLGDRLNKVLVTLSEEAKMEQLPRFRFKEFKDNNRFILIADGKVKNPLNCPAIIPTEDIIVSVSGNDIEVAIGGECASYRMK